MPKKAIDVKSTVLESTALPSDDLKSVITEVNASQSSNSHTNQSASHSHEPSYDWKAFEHESLDNYLNYWDEELSYTQNIEQLVKQCTLLPEQDTLAKIITTYTVTHSVACNWLPMLMLYGQSGTGKSQLNKLIASIRGQRKNIRSGETTSYVGMRNIINQYKWKQPDLMPREVRYARDNEKHMILFLTDIKDSVLKDEHKFAFYRVSCDRSEQIMSVSSDVSGTNADFYTFSQKVLTSASDFFLRSEYKEVLRRMIVIPTYDLSNYPIDVQEIWQESAISVDAISWDGIEKRFDTFWSTDRLNEFGKLGRQHGNWKKYAKKLGFTEHQFTASWDLMRTCYAAEITGSPAETRDLFMAYWEFYKKVITGVSSGLHMVVSGIVQPEIDKHQANCELLKEADFKGEMPKLYIPAKLVKELISNAVKDGALITSSQESWASAMADLGFKLVNSSKGMQWEYVKK